MQFEGVQPALERLDAFPNLAIAFLLLSGVANIAAIDARVAQGPDNLFGQAHFALSFTSPQLRLINATTLARARDNCLR